MKIVLSCDSEVQLKEFLNLSNINNIEIIDASIEKTLFNVIHAGDVDAFVLENSIKYSQRAIDLVKKKCRYIPVIVIIKSKQELTNADIYMFHNRSTEELYRLIIKNIIAYEKNFSSLKKLTSTNENIVEFNKCSYDPNKRLLYHRNKEVAKLSEKTGGILEVLAMNYGNIVRKDLVLEKVWLKNDYFSGRSMDVYVSSLRKIFKDNNINNTIKNISKVGLILQ